MRAQSETPDEKTFTYLDVFDLEVAADPQISPGGSQIVYVRRGSDVMTDRARTSLWIIDYDGSGHRPLTDGTGDVSQPRWSPDGDRLLYVSSEDGSAQLWVRWMDTGQTAELTNLTESPGGLSWSPDGEWIAMTQFVPEAVPPFGKVGSPVDKTRVELLRFLVPSARKVKIGKMLDGFRVAGTAVHGGKIQLFRTPSIATSQDDVSQRHERVGIGGIGALKDLLSIQNAVVIRVVI